MALLRILLILITWGCWLIAPSSYAFDSHMEPIGIVYDESNPSSSVGIIGSTLVVKGDHYENYQVVDFEEQAVVLHELETGDAAKLLAKGKVPKLLQKHAQHRFIAEELKRIYQAQVEYLKDFQDGYARSLKELIAKHYLSDGFDEQGVKQDYFFSVQVATHEYRKEPSFLVVARPAKETEKDWFFSVDQLGLVRYADTLEQVTWGPVWDYNQPYSEVKMQDIGVV